MDEIRDKARLGVQFYAECTPGYYNNEGKLGNPNGFFSGTYGAGPIPFFKMLGRVARRRGRCPASSWTVHRSAERRHHRGVSRVTRATGDGEDGARRTEALRGDRDVDVPADLGEDELGHDAHAVPGGDEGQQGVVVVEAAAHLGRDPCRGEQGQHRR